MAQNESIKDARQQVDAVARKASPWVDAIARIGYVAKGTVYAAIGILAGQVALGLGGKTTGTTGAVEHIGSQPFGKILLVLLAIGLIGYALWKIVQGVMDPDDKGTGIGGIIKRVAYGGSAMVHIGIAFSALEELFGTEGQSTTLDQWTAYAMSYHQPLGQILVGLAGLGVLVVGFYQFFAGVTARFRGEVESYHMGKAAWWALLTGRVGTASRAIVILLAGSFVVLAAWEADPDEARGLGGALATILRQPFGPYLLAIVAAGLVVYGVFMLMVARYRDIEAN